MTCGIPGLWKPGWQHQSNCVVYDRQDQAGLMGEGTVPCRATSPLSWDGSQLESLSRWGQNAWKRGFTATLHRALALTDELLLWYTVLPGRRGWSTLRKRNQQQPCGQLAAHLSEHLGGDLGFEEPGTAIPLRLEVGQQTPLFRKLLEFWFDRRKKS